MWESIGGSRYICEYGGMSPEKQIKVITRLFGRRGMRVRGKDGFFKYYVFMPATRRHQLQLLFDVDTESYEVRVPVREFSTSGQDERGAKCYPEAPSDGGRFSLTTFAWTHAPHDDPNELDAIYHIPEWYAPIGGTWSSA